MRKRIVQQFCMSPLIDLSTKNMYHTHNVSNKSSTAKVHGISPMGCWHYMAIKDHLCFTDTTEDVTWICKKIPCIFSVAKGVSRAKKLPATPRTSKTAKSTRVETRLWQDEPLPNPNVRQAAVLANFSEQIYCLYQADSQSEKSITAFCALSSFKTCRGEAVVSWRERCSGRSLQLWTGQSASPGWVLELIHRATEKIRVTFVTKSGSAIFLLCYGSLRHYFVNWPTITLISSH